MRSTLWSVTASAATTAAKPRTRCVRQPDRCTTAGKLPGKGGVTVICGRCDRAIVAGETYDEHDKVSSSAGGITIYLHKRCPSMSSRSGRQGCDRPLAGPA